MLPKPPRLLFSLLLGLPLASLSACGGSGSSAASSPVGAASTGTGQQPPPVTPIVKPLTPPATINLYPATDGHGHSFLYVKATSVGSVGTNMPLAFDTGSSALTLNALDIFPTSIVGSNGFIFPDGQTSITYDGITVTNEVVTLHYSGPTLTGNLGFAQVTFGDSSGTLTTTSMPIVFYYSGTAPNGELSTQLPEQGIFGVNSTGVVISPSGATSPSSPLQPCSPQSSGDCFANNVLEYLTYPDGVDAGFMLSPATVNTCDILAAGNCQAEPILTVGLTPAALENFNTTSLACPPSDYAGPASIRGYSVCSTIIPDVTVAVSAATFVGRVLFDTGTPRMYFNPPGLTSASNVAAGTTVTVTTPSGFTYGYLSDTQLYATGEGSASPSIVGLGYFTTNSFFLDMTANTVGWK